VVVRITDKSKIELTLGQGELMLHPKVLTALKRVLALPCGLILISGATGSGKSSTIIAALRSQNFDKFNIITLEDPVEETINGVSHIQVDNTIERNNFRSCMSTAVRLDPDIINIGEVRDDESASAVINAAMTGHLVLSTIHSASSSLIISRLEHFGVKRYDIAQTLVAACSQRLIRVLCQHCCVPHVCTQDDVDIYGIPKEWFDEQVVLNKRTVDGCPECNGLGYSGRTPLLEILPISKDTASDLGDGTLLPLDLDTRVKKEFDVPLMRDLALDALKSGISDIEAVTSVIAL
jgi:type II secretory ATPase GspE/PulE/Tfp pilus assembly ATPase PilB-like protein